jgi:hypothetical protein
VVRESGCGFQRSLEATKRELRRPSQQRRAELFQTTLDAALIQAYRETEYRVAGDQPFTLRIGEVSAELQALRSSSRAEPYAYITACNPFSQDVSHSENAERHAQHGAELAKRGLTHIEGVGQHPSNNWPGEPSYLILGLDLEAARTLGMRMDRPGLTPRQQPKILACSKSPPRPLLVS